MSASKNTAAKTEESKSSWVFTLPKETVDLSAYAPEKYELTKQRLLDERISNLHALNKLKRGEFHYSKNFPVSEESTGPIVSGRRRIDKMHAEEEIAEEIESSSSNSSWEDIATRYQARTGHKFVKSKIVKPGAAPPIDGSYPFDSPEYTPMSPDLSSLVRRTNEVEATDLPSTSQPQQSLGPLLPTSLIAELNLNSSDEHDGHVLQSFEVIESAALPSKSLAPTISNTKPSPASGPIESTEPMKE